MMAILITLRGGTVLCEGALECDDGIWLADVTGTSSHQT